MKRLFGFCIILMGFSFSHPFYLSVTDLKYKSDEKTMQASVKVFVNDLETALKKINQKPIDLLHPKDTMQLDKILATYLAKHLTLKVNSEVRQFDFIGFEIEQEAIWMYLEYKSCPSPKKVEIENSLLYDFIKEQSNIVKLEVNGKNQSSKVSYPDTFLHFEF